MCSRSTEPRLGIKKAILLDRLFYWVFGWDLVVCVRSMPLTPALSRGRGSRFVDFSKPEFDSISQVGV
ncbi:hypothetical protein EMIT0232MI5_40410 [Pseudomonas sp. IT-232MI5]